MRSAWSEPMERRASRSRLEIALAVGRVSPATTKRFSYSSNPTTADRGWGSAVRARSALQAVPGSASRFVMATPPGRSQRVTVAIIIACVVVFLGTNGFSGGSGKLWNDLLHPSDLVVLLILYVTTGLGVTVGFHRLFTHRSFETYKLVQFV